MQTLYRAVPIKNFDPTKVYRPHATARPPSNVPYVVDNLWEVLRPITMPSRRHAIYASPTPALALANASSGGADRSEYVVCTVNVDASRVRIAQLQCTDARDHGDVRRLQRMVIEELGDLQALSFKDRCAIGPLFLPVLSAGDARQLTGMSAEIARVIAKATAISYFWASASNDVSPDSAGELFFELPEDGSYTLTPIEASA